MARVQTISIDKHLSKDICEQINVYVREQLEFMTRTWDTFFKGNIPEMRRLYKGIPANEYVDFPWENASNLVLQVIGTNVDNLSARVMGSIWQVMPLYQIATIGEWDKTINAEALRAAVEEMLFTFAIDPDILDLYRKEQLWYTDAIKYGYKVMKIPYETCIEANILAADSIVDNIIYEGPKPENIEPEDFMTYPTVNKIQDSPFKCHRVRLTRQQLEERIHTHMYDKKIIESIFDMPDDYGTTFQEKEDASTANLASPSNRSAAHYYLYECWFPYFVNEHKYRLIITWSKKADKPVRAIFNFYHDNMEPFEVARLGYRISDFRGYGFAEMFEAYQEEVSATHNKRQDNMTVANVQGVRISTRNTKVDANFKIAPAFVFPGEKDDIEAISIGTAYRSTQPDEELTLKEISDRSGISPAVTGLGGGTMSKKGIYSSQGTFAAMQAGNSRSDLDVMDMRYAHLKLGRKLMQIYAQFGVMKSHLNMFGTMAPKIKEALNAIADHKLMLAANTATASINRELERQNSILLSSQLQRQQQANSQMLQAIANPQVPPQIKQYLQDCFEANNMLMKKILRAFNFDDLSKYVPELKELSNGVEEPTATNNQIPGANRGPRQEASAITAIPTAGMGGFQGIPQ